jgi:hypothetical protein
MDCAALIDEGSDLFCFVFFLIQKKVEHFGGGEIDGSRFYSLGLPDK